MGFKMTTDIKQVELLLQKCFDIVNEEIQRGLSILGEKCVTKVRDRGYDESWFDQTGNLRSSIGYAIYNHGKKMIESSFAVVKNGGEGANEGRRMVEELAKMYSGTYALVVLAGMNYAENVERMENKDVLASTELWAKTQVDEHIKNSMKRAIQRINKEL